MDENNKNFTVDDNGILYTNDKKTLIAVPSDVNPIDGILQVPEGVENIQLGAIIGNNNITTLALPASVSNVAVGYPSIMNRCSKVTKIIVNSGNSTYYSSGDLLVSKNDNKLILFPCGR